MALESYTVRIEGDMLDKIRYYVLAIRKTKKTTAQEVINDAIREHVESVLSARMEPLDDFKKGAA